MDDFWTNLVRPAHSDLNDLTEIVWIDEVTQLTIMHVNIRSMGKNFDEFLIWFSNKIKTVHIIILSEAWLSSENDTHFHIPDYSFAIMSSNYNKASGVCAFVHNSVSFSTYDKQNSILDILHLNCKYRNFEFTVQGIYKSPDVNVVDAIKENRKALD